MRPNKLVAGASLLQPPVCWTAAGEDESMRLRERRSSRVFVSEVRVPI